MVVVKVGGSLFDLPDLGPRLRRFLASLGAVDWLVVAGGGAAAEAIRHLDRIHGLGAESSHWLALRACTLNAHFLLTLLPGAALVAWPGMQRERGVLDALAFTRADEVHPDALPHGWEATSDALAARAAVVAGGELVLLKSRDIPEDLDWEEAARAGFVDPVFPVVVARGPLRVRTVNLRAWNG